jgi:iron complex outermembrane recepter protein
MRLTVTATAVCLSIIGYCWAPDADAAMRKPVDIPAEGLGPALQALARDRGLQIIYRSDTVDSLRTQGAAGDFTAAEALTRLLNGTGLSFRYLDSNTVSVFPSNGAGGAERLKTSTNYALPNRSDEGTPLAPSGGVSRSDFRLAQAKDGLTDNSSASESSPDEGGTRIEEIIVTAQKRSERLQDVPVPVTAIHADTLVNNSQLRLQDYYTSIPGLTVTPSVPAAQVLSIRGITTGPGNPTVGITVDDVPYGASTEIGGGIIVPDIDPGDLDRVEVLRGPQGTLYGASSMGGLIKFVTVDPSTDEVSGRVQSGTSSVYNGAQLGYNARGSVNVPLSDSLAVRASAFTRLDPGYIDNPVRAIDGVNEARASGGRLAALWRPSEVFSLKLSALYQQVKGDGSSDVDLQPGLGDLQQNYLRGSGAYDKTVQAYSAILSAKLGSVDLTAVSGYSVNAYKDSFDYSYAFLPLANAFFGVTGSPVFDDNTASKFTQEVRLSAPLGQKFEWLLGAFYTHEKSSYSQNVVAEDSTTGVVASSSALNLSFPSTYEEYAAFADLTYHVTDRFDVQIGGRESQIRQSSTETETGLYVPVLTGGARSPYILPEADTKASAFTYLVTPRFRISSDLMVYARLASGYRAGGPNLSPGGVVPTEYNPDKTQNYEVGVKGDFLDRKFSVDASVYYIDWKQIQLQATNPLTQIQYDFNGSRAKSQGVELSVESRPLTGMTIAAWVVWNDAVLTEAFPAANSQFGVPGDGLPYSSRFSGNLSLQQDFPLASRVTGHVGGALAYVGDRQGVFTADASRQDFPAYAKMDLRAGAKYDSWTADFFVNNVADRRGVLTGGLGNNPPFGFVYIQPRTVGLSLVKTF